MSYSLLQTRNLRVFWQCQARSPDIPHSILIQFTLTWVGTENSLEVPCIPKLMQRVALTRTCQKSCQALRSDQAFGLTCAWAGCSLTDPVQILNPGPQWWKFSALKSDSSLFFWLELTLTPAPAVLYSASVCSKPNFLPRFPLKWAPSVLQTDVFAATLVQVNNHSSKVHVGFRVYPLELS